MKKTFLISYDLGIPETSTDYEKVIKYIKSFSSYAKPLKSEWLIVSDKSVSEIRDALMNLTDANDKILIFDVSGDSWATARIGGAVTTWMKNNI
jgi:hypothetical protein